MMFVKPDRIKKETGLSSSTLKRYRTIGVFKQGVHWQQINSRLVLYNLELVQDWLANRDNMEKHQEAVNRFFMSLPSYQAGKPIPSVIDISCT